MTTIKNPILKGFNPDPAILRVGEDYYIATSTFEWFPGVQIHHSTDLKHWELLAHPLQRVSQLDMRGVPDSCGVWAPCLSYSDGTFYLVYSNVKSFDGLWKDTPNYVVTTNDISGEWSEPSYLSSAGFDGALYHDDDGRKWYASMLINHLSSNFFGGIVLQEYDDNDRKLIGPIHHITPGTELGCTEGPRFYKRNGYYYLLLAEGGTEYGHATTVMRSKSITGPYELHPRNPIVTSRYNPELELQKAGHASMVETQDGSWYIVFLVGRPLSTLGRCILGRETAIEEIAWQDDWPVLKHGSSQPRIEIPAPLLTNKLIPNGHTLESFDQPKLSPHFQSLRVPIDESWCSLTKRSGYLQLRGRESLTSLHKQSLVARRVQSYHVTASTSLEFDPATFQEMAGLVFYYNTGHFHYLYVTASPDGSRKVLRVISSNNFEMHSHEESVDITGYEHIILHATMQREALQFSYSLDGKTYIPMGPVLDASILSDDHVRDGSERYRPAFTGCFVGLCCQDLAHNQKWASFEWFDYTEND